MRDSAETHALNLGAGSGYTSLGGQLGLFTTANRTQND